MFLIELLLNMYGNFFLKFFKSLWNIFDFLIVVVSLVALFGDGFDVTALRMFRALRRTVVAFRVVRLLRLKHVKMIVLGVLKSLPGVSNAFLLLGLIMGIWSIMGVNFYCELFPDYYGNFFKGMLTHLQIMSFDSWSSGITRPIILHDETADVLGGLFFIAYVFASAIIMANVVLAILIDKFLSTAKEIQLQEKKEKDAAKAAEEQDTQQFQMQQFSEVINFELGKLQEVITGPMQAFTQDLLGRVD
jgi:voltage-gated sodium channel